MATNPKVIDTEFELFWRDVGEAVRIIEMTHTDEMQTLDIERGTRGATIKLGTMKSAPAAYLVIGLWEATPKQPALIVP